MPFQPTTGFCKCNTLLYQAGKNIKEYFEFSSHMTRETFQNYHYLDCNSKSNLDLFDILQGVSQIKCAIYNREVQFPVGNYQVFSKKSLHKEDFMQMHLRKDFLSNCRNGLINDVEVVFINKSEL